MSAKLETDVIVVGSGAAGFMAAMAARQEGARVELIRRGQGATALSSGAIDLCGAFPDGSPCLQPREGMASWARCEGHPWGRLSAETVDRALESFQFHLGEAGLPYRGSADENLTLITVVGTVKRTALAPVTQASGNLGGLESPVAVVGLQGLPGFSPELVVHSLGDLLREGSLPGPGKSPAFEALTISVPSLQDRPYFSEAEVARALDREHHFAGFSEALHQALSRTQARAVALPPVLGWQRAAQLHRYLEERLSIPVFELLPLYRSVPGLRLQDALERRIESMAAADNPPGWEAEALELGSPLPVLKGRMPAGTFAVAGGTVVLAAGDLVGGGIQASRDGLGVPLLELSLAPGSDAWEPTLWPGEGQAALAQGLTTDNWLRPVDGAGKPVSPNLFAAGAILGGYHPVREMTGLGLAVSSGMEAGKFAALQALERRDNW